KPTFFLDEYACLLKENQYLGVSMSTIHQAFERAGISTKAVRKIAQEQSSAKRAAFIY
ncbi:hypothetical protein L218DRAFT_870406, partial [Marasmius fiardii PR-910]